MNTRLLTLTVAILATAALQSFARNHEEIFTDSLKESHRIIFIGDGSRPATDSIRAAIDMFYMDQFRHFQDPRAPYFLFLSKDNKLAMGIGGVVRMRGWYDWGGIIGYNGFIPYAIPVPKNDADRRKLDSTPAGTAFFFRVIGRNHKLGDYQLYIEANFNGYQSRDFHLKKAYATVNDWTVGYASSSFSDPTAAPPTVDAQGPQAYVQTTAVLLRWMHTFRKHWTTAASVEMPDSRVDADNISTGKSNDWFPNIAAFGQYGWNTDNHLRISGIMRILPYRDIIARQNRNVTGWGIQLSSSFRPTGQLRLFATASGGRGYGSLTGDLLMGNFDLIGKPDDKGRMYAPASFTWLGAAQYHFRPDLFASATLGQERLLPRHGIDSSTYKYGLYSALNVFWYPVPRLELAGELNLGKRKNFNGESRWARRISLMVQFSF
ncbi:MAG: hypothetical protein IJY31_01690 [Muribaculaceae bacterium]|nr:hypothetical protein [Muribaculaceae bacterium]